MVGLVGRAPDQRDLVGGSCAAARSESEAMAATAARAVIGEKIRVVAQANPKIMSFMVVS